MESYSNPVIKNKWVRWFFFKLSFSQIFFWWTRIFFFIYWVIFASVEVYLLNQAHLQGFYTGKLYIGSFKVFVLDVFFSTKRIFVTWTLNDGGENGGNSKGTSYLRITEADAILKLLLKIFVKWQNNLKIFQCIYILYYCLFSYMTRARVSVK